MEMAQFLIQIQDCSVDHYPKYPLALNEKFTHGATYWYRSLDYSGINLTDYCTRIFYFVAGMVFTRRLNECSKGGVRTVKQTHIIEDIP